MEKLSFILLQSAILSFIVVLVLYVCVAGCINRNSMARAKDIILPQALLVKSLLEHQVWFGSFLKDIDKLDHVQKMMTRKAQSVQTMI